MRTILSLIVIAACAGACARPSQPGAPRGKDSAMQSVPERTGDVRDFDFLAGHWRVANRTMKPDADGSERWTTFASTACATLHLGGVVNVDEFQFPSRGYSAMTVRTFDLAKRQWSIYWIESRAGVLLPPVRGGFTGDRGEFYGPDEIDGQPVVFRYVWTRLGRDRARWEQAYSRDGDTWTANWIMEFTRTSDAPCSAT